MANTNQNRPFYDAPKSYLWLPQGNGFTARTNLPISTALPAGFIFLSAVENYADRIIGRSTAVCGAIAAGGKMGVSLYKSIPNSNGQYERIIDCGIFVTDVLGPVFNLISPRVELPAGVYIAGYGSNGVAVGGFTGNSAYTNGVYVGQDFGLGAAVNAGNEVLPAFLDTAKIGGSGGSSVPTIRLER